MVGDIQAHYAAVIADLERKRAEIDKLLESLRPFALADDGASTPRRVPPEIHRPSETTSVASPAKGEFTGMNFADAARVILARQGKPMTNMEMVEALSQGGLRTTAAQPLNTIGSIMNRRYQQVGDIVRVGRGVWGLREWGLPGEEHQGELASAQEEFEPVDLDDETESLV